MRQKNRQPVPWREKFKCFSFDSNDFLFMDEKLVFPKVLRPIILRSLLYGHPGRDTMPATVSNVWWPRLHREVVGIAQPCQQCETAGKNNKPVLGQSQEGKSPVSTEKNQQNSYGLCRAISKRDKRKKISTCINRSFYRVAGSKIFPKTKYRKGNRIFAKIYNQVQHSKNYKDRPRNNF